MSSIMSNKETAKAIIGKLVEKFTAQLELYKAGKYNETQTRIDFINPMFEALGWDIDNRTDKLETERDVFHEDKVLTDEGLKSPDYAFTINGTRQFYLEAKKPSVNIKDDISPAFQLRRYGWTTKLVISILTDFEELAVYDCFEKPVATNAAAHSRIKYIKFTNYEKEFDYIWDLLSREAVVNGSILRYAEKSEYRGAEDVDTAFLNSLDEWRDYLAKAMITGNKNMTEDDLNFAVQQTLDRIIFLRICEDRGIEIYKTMLNFVEKSKGDIYPQLFAHFVQADQKYNSGLFDFKKDTISRNLQIDNKVLRNIIEELYPPQSPYAFAVIPVEILGNAYEQFLGKTIKITSGNRIEIEQKPEVRKAGGVYYTPQYIVSYIVKQTVGKKIEEIENHQKTLQGLEDLARFDIIAEVAKLKICDPACGSGSFLLGAYQYLLDWHLNYYTKNSPPAPEGGVKKTSKVPPSGVRGLASPLTSEGKLTSTVKKQILLNNIFGVDIDVNAVEVTKLSLLLKAIEGETAASIHTTNVMFNERALPTLDNNIQSGNSLIDMDFYENQIDFTPQEEKKIKPFNWQLKFPQVFKQGKGFDVVIGNPPYVRQELLLSQTKKYFQLHYQVYQGTADLYSFFIEKGIKLLKDNGLYSVIVANKWMRASYGEPLRKFLLQKKLVEIIDFGDLQIFQGATTYPCILTVQNSKINAFDKIAKSEKLPEKLEELSKIYDLLRQNAALPENIKQSLVISEQNSNIKVFADEINKLYAYKKELNGLFDVLQNSLQEIDKLRMEILEVIEFRTTLIKEKFDNLEFYIQNHNFIVQQNALTSNNWTLAAQTETNLLNKIENLGIPLGTYIQNGNFRGILTGLSEAFVIDKATKDRLIKEDKNSKAVIKPFLAGKNVKKFQKPFAEKYLILFPKGFTNLQGNKPADAWAWLEKNYVAIANYLLPFKEKAEKRTDKGDYWWELRACDYYDRFEKPKIMYQVFQVKPCFVYDTNGLFSNNSMFFIPTNDKYLLALLNSKLGWFLISKYCTQIQNGYQLIWKYFEKLPIKSINFSNKTEKALHDRIVVYVEQILADYEKINNLSFEFKKQPLQDKISYAEMQIDKLVCELYGLSEAEMAVVL
jgi:hypothetical protein